MDKDKVTQQLTAQTVYKEPTATIGQAVERAVNTPEYRTFRYLWNKGIYDERIYSIAEDLINHALCSNHVLDDGYIPLRVNYTKRSKK